MVVKLGTKGTDTQLTRTSDKVLTAGCNVAPQGNFENY